MEVEGKQRPGVTDAGHALLQAKQVEMEVSVSAHAQHHGWHRAPVWRASNSLGSRMRNMVCCGAQGKSVVMEVSHRCSIRAKQVVMEVSV